MHRSFPICPLQDHLLDKLYHIDLICSASQEKWMNIQRGSCVSDEWPSLDHFPNKPIILTSQALFSMSSKQWMCRGFPSVINLKLSPRRLEWMCRGVHVSVMKAIYKTPFWVSLLYCFNELFLPRNLLMSKQRLPLCHLQVAFLRSFFNYKSTVS